MQAGKLLYPIKIYKQEKIKSDYGDEKYKLTFVCNTRAGVDFSSQNRTITNDELQYVESRTFLIRYYVPINEFDIIEYDNKQWIINTINDNKPYQQKTVIATLKND